MSDKRRTDLPARPAEPPRVAWVGERLEKLRRRDELLRQIREPQQEGTTSAGATDFQ